jgi:hypothetical protein
MAYIGRGVDKISNIEVLDAITFTNSAGPYNLLKDTVAFVPTSSNALVISIDGIVQSPSSYTVSAATITFDTSMASTSTMNFIYQIGVGLMTTPSDDSVTTAKIAALSVTAAKIATDAVETAKIKDLNVTTDKLAADAVTNAKTEFTPGLTIKGDGASADGKITLNCSQNSHGVSVAGPPHSAGQSYTLTLPSSITDGYFLKTDGSGNLSFVEVVTGEGPIPTITTSSLIAEPTTDTTLTLAGTNFVSIPKLEIIATTGAVTVAPTVSFTSSTSLDFTTGTGLAAGNYNIRVVNPDGGTVTSGAILNVSPGPAWVTASGSLGSFAGGASVGTINLTATDSTGMTLQSGSLPGGVSLTSAAGTSTLTGTESGSSATTTYSFTIRATDAEAQTADRAFTITITHGLEQGLSFT